MPRRLGPDEKALWGKVMATVKPLHEVKAKAEPTDINKPVVPAKAGTPVSKAHTSRGPRLRGDDVKLEPANNLDSHWDRRIKRGGIVPDISIDLHDANLSRAYVRLDGALEQAIAQKFKVILLVTGKPRTHDRASGEGRGAIAAVVRDWLAASRHSRHISAVRNAHPRHGGAGALYIMLKS
jgi:DNA-nicking Smr family endonuclease